MRIIEELVEIWPNKVYNSPTVLISSWLLLGSSGQNKLMCPASQAVSIRFLIVFSIFFLLIFSLDIMSHLRVLMASWNCVSSAHDTLSATLATYQNQVFEFAKELLVSQEYFSYDPDYWVSSGLVDSTKSQDAFFKAAYSTCDSKTGFSSQAAAARLFDAHFARALPFLISVVTFLIHSYLTRDMHKSFKICSLFAISILIRVKVGLEFSVLFSLSRYIFCLFFLYLLFLFIYIYISLL